MSHTHECCDCTKFRSFVTGYGLSHCAKIRMLYHDDEDTCEDFERYVYSYEELTEEVE